MCKTDDGFKLCSCSKIPKFSILSKRLYSILKGRKEKELKDFLDELDDNCWVLLNMEEADFTLVFPEIGLTMDFADDLIDKNTQIDSEPDFLWDVLTVKLNEKNCFDFDYKHKVGDYLLIKINSVLYLFSSSGRFDLPLLFPEFSNTNGWIPVAEGDDLWPFYPEFGLFSSETKDYSYKEMIARKLLNGNIIKEISW